MGLGGACRRRFPAWRAISKATRPDGSRECRSEPNKNSGENSERDCEKRGLPPPMHAQIFANERAVEFLGGLMGANQRTARKGRGALEARKIRIRCPGRPLRHETRVT